MGSPEPEATQGQAVRWDRRLRRFVVVSSGDAASLIADRSPEDRSPAPVSQRVSQRGAPLPLPPGKPASTPPNLARITPADLASTARLLSLHGQAVAAGRYPAGDASRLLWVAVAEHARRCATTNAPGLFVALIRDGGPGGLAGRVVTQADEDAARLRIRDHDRPRTELHTILPTAIRAPGRMAGSPYAGRGRPASGVVELGGVLARVAGGVGIGGGVAR
jgi:hypothetical protein